MSDFNKSASATNDEYEYLTIRKLFTSFLALTFYVHYTCYMAFDYFPRMISSYLPYSPVCLC